MQLASTKNPSCSGELRMGLGFMGALDGGGSAVRVIARAKSKSDQAAALALGRLCVRLRFVEGANPNATSCVGDPGDSIDDEEVVVVSSDESESDIFTHTHTYYISIKNFYFFCFFFSFF